jgi:hypothetical protein
MSTYKPGIIGTVTGAISLILIHEFAPAIPGILGVFVGVAALVAADFAMPHHEQLLFAWRDS